jgi:hypothetical protein
MEDQYSGIIAANNLEDLEVIGFMVEILIFDLELKKALPGPNRIFEL